MPTRSSSLRRRLQRVRLFLCDVDGVMTDGTVWMGGGKEWKRFGIRDGLGLKFLQQEGIRVGWISRRPSAVTRQRARELQIDFLIQSDGGKVAGVEAILRRAGLGWADVCFVGDDVVDVGVLQRAGVGVAVADAVREARAAARYVTRAPGGLGAVREVAELILKARNRWGAVVARYAA
jgi:3-deoxy-D-manno-octulosonate 8-phosphate phosphatase (KDO 8-P phosphatase)